MSSISSAALLDALDGATSEIEQVIGVLRAVGHDPLSLSMAVGDRALVALAEHVTSGVIEVTAACPACAVTNLIVLSSERLGDHRPRSRWFGERRGVREPTYGDLLDLPTEPEHASTVLALRCAIGVIDATTAAIALDDVDESLAGPVEVTCVDCGHGIVVEVDVQQLALRRLRGAAERFDREVHLLATAYGWDLATIQSLPTPRRQRFARLIEAG